jgi:hypothetical protein
MVSLAKFLTIRQGIVEKYKNIGLEKFWLSIMVLTKKYLQVLEVFE